MAACFCKVCKNQTILLKSVTAEPDVVHACYLSTWEMETGHQGHPQVHTKFEVRLSYSRPCLKTDQNKQN